MYRNRLFAATLVLALLAPAGREVRATESTPDVVFEWNQILQDTIPGAGAVGAARFYAMTHIAMFDAINAIEREFEPYRVRLRHRSGGSPAAAAAQAAHDVLVALNPPAAPAYDALLAQQLGTKPSGFVAARRGGRCLAWRRRSWRGGRTTGGWSPVLQPMPSRFFPDAGSPRRRTTRPRHSPIFRTPRRWRC